MTDNISAMFANDSIPSNQNNKCVVRVRTTVWQDSRGIHVKKSINFLRRQCKGFNILQEDIGAGGVDEALTRIANLDETKDGIYEVVICNETTDRETGYIDDYEYRLIPVVWGGT